MTLRAIRLVLESELHSCTEDCPIFWRFLVTFKSVLIAVLFWVGPTFANDATFGGAGGALAPLKETRIRMASEDILLEAMDNEYWSVTASYVFENTTSKTVVVQLGFPNLGVWATVIWVIHLP